jgi:hypothetical protein
MAFKISAEAKRRCWEQLQVEQAERTANLRRRIVAAVAEHGPDSLYADMLAEHDRRNERRKLCGCDINLECECRA